MGARWYDAYLNRWISADTIVPDPANPQSFNRYAYVLGNPVLYVDPTGHTKWKPPTSPPPPDEPGRHVPEQWEQTEEYLALGATTCDIIAGATGLIGVIGEGAGLMIGFLEPSPGAGEAVGIGLAIESYYKFVNPIENKVSSWGAALAATGDYFGGRTYVDWENNELVIGQDTIVAYGALGLGNQEILPLEGVGDTIVNGALVAYDLGRLGKHIPTVVENRIGFDSADRGGFYVDAVVYGALAERLGRASGDRCELVQNLSSGQGWTTQ
jgi:hypothetical protein